MPLFRRRKNETDDERGATEDRAENESESPKGGVASATTTLRDLLIVTYAVSVEKAQKLVPEGLPLDKLPGPEGELTAFAQTLVAYHEGARWSPLPGRLGQDPIGASFHQISYRLLTRKDGKKGTFEYRTFTSETEQHITQRALHREADYARMSLFIDGNPARGIYKAFTIRASGDTGKTELDVRAFPEPPSPLPAPFGRIEDMVAFLTQREEVYFRASAPKNRVRRMPVVSGPFAPTYGEVTYARLTPWLDAGLLTAEELTHPLSVLIQPALPLVTRTPHFAKLSPVKVPA
jgi:hypothetical protein